MNASTRGLVVMLAAVAGSWLGMELMERVCDRLEAGRAPAGEPAPSGIVAEAREILRRAHAGSADPAG